MKTTIVDLSNANVDWNEIRALTKRQKNMAFESLRIEREACAEIVDDMIEGVGEFCNATQDERLYTLDCFNRKIVEKIGEYDFWRELDFDVQLIIDKRGDMEFTQTQVIELAKEMSLDIGWDYTKAYMDTVVNLWKYSHYVTEVEK